MLPIWKTRRKSNYIEGGNVMKQLLDYYEHILKNGEDRKDRTGTGVIGVFGYQMRFDLREGFPLPTTKAVPPRIIFEELMWFLRGETDIRPLLDKNVKIWNDDAYRWHKEQNPNSTMTMERFLEVIQMGDSDIHGLGDLGDIYGKQWRSWTGDVKEVSYDNGTYVHYETIDQISNVIESIKNDPYGRRHIVSAWNPGDLAKGKTALPPCHILFQFYVSNNGELSCQLYQRSADSFLGVPFNIPSYAMLVHMIASVTGLKVGEFIHVIGDGHIYKNHYNQIFEQLGRTPKALPTLMVAKKDSIFDIEWEDITITNYNPDKVIKGKVSVGK